MYSPGHQTLPPFVHPVGKIIHSSWSMYLAEFVGTFFLVLTVGSNILTGSVGAALSIGAILMVMIYSLASVSGAHFNPAVTVSIKFSGRGILTMQEVICYVVAQLLGGLAAGATYLAIFGQAFVMEPVGKFSALEAMAVEVIYTTALCYVVLNVATTQKQDGNNYFGLAIGFTVVSAALAIGGISGCCLNPAVSFGAMCVSAIHRGMPALKYFYVYFLIPFLGSMIGAVCFYMVQKADEYCEPPPEPEDYLAANWH